MPPSIEEPNELAKRQYACVFESEKSSTRRAESNERVKTRQGLCLSSSRSLRVLRCRSRQLLPLPDGAQPPEHPFALANPRSARLLAGMQTAGAPPSLRSVHSAPRTLSPATRAFPFFSASPRTASPTYTAKYKCRSVRVRTPSVSPAPARSSLPARRRHPDRPCATCPPAQATLYCGIHLSPGRTFSSGCTPAPNNHGPPRTRGPFAACFSLLQSPGPRPPPGNSTIPRSH